MLRYKRLCILPTDNSNWIDVTSQVATQRFESYDVAENITKNLKMPYLMQLEEVNED